MHECIHIIQLFCSKEKKCNNRPFRAANVRAANLPSTTTANPTAKPTNAATTADAIPDAFAPRRHIKKHPQLQQLQHWRPLRAAASNRKAPTIRICRRRLHVPHNRGKFPSYFLFCKITTVTDFQILPPEALWNSYCDKFPNPTSSKPCAFSTGLK